MRGDRFHAGNTLCIPLSYHIEDRIDSTHDGPISHAVGQWSPFTELLQDYQTFFEAIECDTLYESLRIEIPDTEVEYQRKHEADQQVSPADVSKIT